MHKNQVAYLLLGRFGQIRSTVGYSLWVGQSGWPNNETLVYHIFRLMMTTLEASIIFWGG